MTLPMGRAMREVFGETVSELANQDQRIVMLDGDLGSSTRGEIFQRAHVDRYFQMGIAEQNMLGVAAGMASVGLIPYISTFVAFAVIRPLDQIRVLIAQPRLNVKITAGYAGLFTGRAGKTHQVVDDISIMRAMPNMVTLSPADDTETAEVLRWSATYQGPVYVRLVRDATQHLFDSGYTFQFGAAVALRDGSDVTLISTGAQTPRVVDAAETLAARGFQAGVLHVPTIKPLDVQAIVQAAERSNLVVTIEEHTVIGGLGGAIAETLSEHRPTRLFRIGLADVFGQSASNDDLLEAYGLSANRVADRISALMTSGPGRSGPAQPISTEERER
ncbi:MAG: transketolase C-terminal domain-containing protein [Candidatus Dormibacteria bacterium]|jgi:transketolase